MGIGLYPKFSNLTEIRCYQPLREINGCQMLPKRATSADRSRAFERPDTSVERRKQMILREG